MIFYEYDMDGWLVGWHESADRPNSTAIAPGVTSNRARWVNGSWIEDRSREHTTVAAAVRIRAIAAVQAYLDAHAQSWGYDSLLSASSYVAAKKAKFRAEGQVLMDWRDDVWAAVEQAQNTVQSVEELLALLPAPPARP